MDNQLLRYIQRLIQQANEDDSSDEDPMLEEINEETTVAESDNDLVERINSRTGHQQDNGRSYIRNPVSNSLPNRLNQREIGGRLGYNEKSWLMNSFLPTNSHIVGKFTSQVFCGIYSHDGTEFVSGCQDRNIRIFDTTTWKMKKKIRAIDFGWSILDCDYSRDNQFLVYSTWSPNIFLTKFDGESKAPTNYRIPLSNGNHQLGVFSVRISPDQSTLLAGESNSRIHLCEIETEQSTVEVGETTRVDAHSDDVNAVHWVDSNLFCSGSDDHLVKLWDKRCLSGRRKQPVGVFVGHLAGITSLHSTADGRNLLSNSKDQSAKLWDVRSNISPLQHIQVGNDSNFDYRYQLSERAQDRLRTRRHKDDCSLATYRGHSVLRTLIRARFSPPETTGERYIYTGSSTPNSKIYIYETLTGEQVRTLRGHSGIIRDVSWHPHLPQLISTSWDGTLREWNYENNNHKAPVFIDQEYFDDADVDLY